MDQILIIEDDLSIQALLSLVLGKAGYQVTVADTLREGAIQLQKTEFSLVLLDINLPDGNGLSLLPQFDMGDPPVVVLTADNHCLEAAFAQGAADYLLKPFIKGELLARVNHLITNRHLRLEREKRLIELQEDLYLAAQVQALSLPASQSSAQEESLALDWLYRPLNQVSGDLLTVYSPSPQTRLFCLADVSGHGMAAALIMMALRNSLESQISQGQTSPWQLMAALSERMGSLLERHYITLVIGHLDLESGALTLSNAGHPAPLLRRGQRVLALEGKTAMPLGIQAAASLDLSYEFGTQLQPGDHVMFYSDGLFENSVFQAETGLDALKACWGQHERALNLPELVAQLHGPVPENAGLSEGLRDDLSILALEFKAASFQSEYALNAPTLAEAEADLHLWMLQNQMSETQIQKVQLLWLEAVNNLLIHSEATTLAVQARITHRDFEFSLRDNGQPWQPQLGLDCPPAEAESGRGLWLMEALCETLHFERVQDQNQVLMTFTLHTPQEMMSHV